MIYLLYAAKNPHPAAIDQSPLDQYGTDVNQIPFQHLGFEV